LNRTPVLWPGATLPDPAAAMAYGAQTRATLCPPSDQARFPPNTKAIVCGQTPHALGWAVALARAGFDVTAFEPDQDDARRAADILARAHALGQVPHEIPLASEAARAAGAALVIDTAVSPVHALLDACGPDALVLLIGGPGSAAGPLASRAVCVDTALPPPDARLIELRVRPETAAHQLDRAAGLIRALGATPMRTASFIGAPLRARLEDAAEALVFAGSPPWEVDEALEATGFALGPCAAQDLHGLDHAYARHRQEDATGFRRFPCPVLDRMVPEGRLGQKGGVGWYRYPGGGGRVIDPLIEDLSREEAYFAGRTTAQMPEDDLRRHTILSLIDAAADLSATGIPDPCIDLVSQHACGFPAALGGPMYLGRMLGFATVCDMLERSAAVSPVWAPGRALRTLARARPRLRNQQQAGS